MRVIFQKRFVPSVSVSKSFVVSEKFGKKIAYCLVLSALPVSGILGSRTALKPADCLYIVVTNTSL